MVNKDDDYREIGHFGGNVEVYLKRDEPYNRVEWYGYDRENSEPGNIISLSLAASDGRPVGQFDVDVGYVGPAQRFDEPIVNSFIACDSERKWAFECPNCCGKFRTEKYLVHYELCCPYCYHQQQSFAFLTRGQKKFAKNFAIALAKLQKTKIDEPEKRIKIPIDELSGFLGQNHDGYAEEEQQTSFECSHCDAFVDIYGVFGFCPLCRGRNTFEVFLNSLDQLNDKLNREQIDPAEAVQVAVSRFDAACKDFLRWLINANAQMSKKQARFLNSRRFHSKRPDFEGALMNEVNVTFFDQVSPLDREFFTMMMCRRHLYEHENGVVDDRYIQNSGDQSARAGSLLRESRDNFERFAGLLATVLLNFQASYEAKYPLFGFRFILIDQHEKIPDMNNIRDVVNRRYGTD